MGGFMGEVAEDVVVHIPAHSLNQLRHCERNAVEQSNLFIQPHTLTNQLRHCEERSNLLVPADSKKDSAKVKQIASLHCVPLAMTK